MTTTIISASKPEPVYYSSPSNHRFTLLTRYSQFPGHVAATCLSYLLPNTLVEFIDHFRTNQELVVPANEGFCLRDARLITRNPMKKAFQEEGLSRILDILRRALSVLGKGLKLFVSTTTASYEANCSTEDDEDVYFVCDREVTLKSVRSPVHFRMSDVFRLMHACPIPEVAFAADQEVIAWGISDQEVTEFAEDVRLKRLSDLPKRLVKRRVLPGSGISCEANGSMCLETTSDNLMNGIRFHSGSGNILSFRVGSSHSFSDVREFLDYLDIFGEIFLQKGQKLEIQVSKKRLMLCQQAHDIYGEICNIPWADAILDQLLLHVGKGFDRISWAGETSLGLDYVSSTSTLTITAVNPLVLKPSVVLVCTTLGLLKHTLMDANTVSLCLQGNRTLVLVGLTESEIQYFNEGIDNQRYRNLFPRQNPTGFVWSIDFEKGFRRGICDISDASKGSWLKITPRENEPNFQLILDRATGEELIANLVRRANPQFLAELHDLDSRAISFLLFQALFYYCCEDFPFYRTHELPDFFAGGTAEQITRLLQDDEFIRARDATYQQREDYDFLAALLCKKTAEEFEKIDWTKCSKSLQVIFKKISQVANVGTQRAPLFLTTDLPNFLAKNPLPKTADKATAAADDSKDSKK